VDARLEAPEVRFESLKFAHMPPTPQSRRKGLPICMPGEKYLNSYNFSNYTWTLAILLVVTTLVVQDVLKATKVATTNPISCALRVAEPKMWVSPKFARLQ